MNKKMLLNGLKGIDPKKIMEILIEFENNFKTLATNQLYMQENQLEFEKYLKDIKNNQEIILKILNKEGKK